MHSYTSLPVRRGFPVLFLLTGMLVHAQELSHKQYTVKDGLPGSVVYHTLQDRKGFIWFATNQGVSRFDGHSFTNFSKEDGLPDNEILKLYLDKYDNIWFISFSGIPSVWCNGKISSFPVCKGVFAIIEDFISDSIYLECYIKREPLPDGGYYKTPNKPGHWVFESHLQPVVNLLYESSVLKNSSEKKINFYFSLKDKRYYEVVIKDTASVRHLRFARVKEDVNTILYNPKIPFSFSQDKESVIFSADSLYIAGKAGIQSVISMSDLELKDYDLSSMYFENDSTLWLCTRKKGLIKIENARQAVKKIHYYFPNAFCTAIIKDREGAYWISTHNDGVYYIPDPDSYYIPALAGENAKDIKVIYNYGSQKLLAGATDGSITMLDAGLFTSTAFNQWNNNNKNNRIMDIRPYGKNKFIIASDYGVYVLSGNDKGKRIGLLDGTKSVLVNNDTSLLIAFSSGVFTENPITRKHTLLFSLRTTWIEGNEKVSYWGTLTGLYKFYNNQVIYLGKEYPALAGSINHVDIAPDSAVWVSTQQGLVILKNDHTSVISKKDGLLSDICKHVLFEGDIAWVSTDKGISRVTYHWKENIPVYTMAGITENDGLLSDDVNQCALSGNYIWAATARGISAFPKNYTGHVSTPPLINITSVTAGDNEVASTGNVMISYKKNNLLIGLSGISYRSGKQIHYEYRIKDIDTNWNRAITGQLEFSVLPFGTHLFEARAVDRWGTKSADTKQLFFTVVPPFWKTSWFIFLTYFITAVLIGLAVYLFYRSRQYKKDKEHRLEKRMYELEIMALKAQMNPHFIFNCLSSIQHHILRADTVNANLYLHKFSTLIRNTLELSSSSDITLEEELKMLNAYLELEKLRMGDRMQYSITVDESIRPAMLRIPSMIIQPYVENSIRHGLSPLQNQPGMVSIDFSVSGNYLVCTIEDNGIGISASVEGKKNSIPGHRSMGTGITTNRINIINAIQKDKMRLRVTDKKEQGNGQGTIVQLSFQI